MIQIDRGTLGSILFKPYTELVYAGLDDRTVCPDRLLGEISRIGASTAPMDIVVDCSQNGFWSPEDGDLLWIQSLNLLNPLRSNKIEE